MTEDAQFEAVALIAIMGFLLDNPPDDVEELRKDTIARVKVFIRDNLADALKKAANYGQALDPDPDPDNPYWPDSVKAKPGQEPFQPNMINPRKNEGFQ